VKIIHLVENLDRGAVENWLMRMLRFGVDRGVSLDWTFYCTLGVKGQLDSEVQKLGGRIIYSPAPLSSRGAFLHALRCELRDGRYDVMHCHHDLVSAVYLLASIGLPIRKRIVHAHNADQGVQMRNRLKAWLFRPLLRGICLTMADCIVGISNHTLDTFLVGRQRRPGRDVVHYYGIDATLFKSAAGDHLAFRRTLGLPDDCRILLFAGRMVPEKNPLFVLDVFAELHRLDPATAVVFVGAGSLDDAIRQRACELKLEGAFRHLGWRNDIAAIMAYCDWFILPRPEHPMEGFGLAVVEAQLAGLRLMLSKGVSDDPLLPTAVCRRLRIAAGRRAWADAALDLLHKPAPSPAEALKALKQSPFDMAYALQHLQSLYGPG
jgi:glycosyltransferase involved in cell wall biosynthesis